MRLGLLAFTVKSIEEYDIKLKIFHIKILFTEISENDFIAIGKGIPLMVL